MEEKTIPDLLSDYRILNEEYEKLTKSYLSLLPTTVGSVVNMRDALSHSLLEPFREFEQQSGVKIAQVHCVRNAVGEICDVEITSKL